MSVSSNQSTEEYRGKKFHQGGRVFPESSTHNSHSQRWEGEHTSEGFSDQGFFIGGIYGKTGMTDSDENSSRSANKHTSSEKVTRKVEKKKRHGRRNSVGSLSEFDWRNECSDSDSEEIDSEEFQKAFLREKEVQNHRKQKADSSFTKGRNYHSEGMTKEILLQLEKERNFRQRKGHHGHQKYDTSFDPSLHKKDILFHAERERNFDRRAPSQEIDSSHSEGMTREILQQLEKERNYERRPHASYIQDSSTHDEIPTRELVLNLQKEQNFDRKARSSFGASTTEESEIGTRELVLNLQKEQNFDRKARSSFGASTTEESEIGTRELLLGLRKERSIERPPGQGFSTTEESESQEQFDNFLHGLERERDFERNLRIERLQKEIEDQKHHNQQYEENHQASMEFFNRRPELGFGSEKTSDSTTSEAGWGDKTHLQAFELESVGSKIQQQLEAMSEQIRDEIYKGCKKIRRTQRVSSLVAVEEIFAAKNESVQELELFKQEFLEYIAHRKDEIDNASNERTLTSDSDISIEIEKIRREQQNMLQMVQSLVKMVFRPQN
ncbi:hypothetical protein pv_98 [Pithovirus sibericum]|uniref:Uncharacterized protein n=1 Tax=Pithovirus sibericum TaxID=1450746 RepID=W5SA88_9VIRU|nr:hypothetical protein pv_98 [Pithovirus sibericum]AHH01665.1 hypothetical protein pv_98 [Pithovirus sibericum]